MVVSSRVVSIFYKEQGKFKKSLQCCNFSYPFITFSGHDGVRIWNLGRLWKFDKIAECTRG